MKYNKENFCINTFANWTKTKLPKREPDYISESGSRYWYEEDGVIRFSNHWNSYIRSCDWYLNGKVVRKWDCGFAKWEDFKPVEINIGEIVLGGIVHETWERKPFEYYKEKYNL